MNLYFERLRPRSLDQLALSPPLQSRLDRILKEHASLCPHLIFEGPPGTGKTSLAKILARHYLGQTSVFNYLELNASSQRGVDTVRDQIQGFISTRAFVHQDCPFKIVFLDQADELTPHAQTALRNLMETYAKNARFILSCNMVSKIILPLRSRCLTMSFEPIPAEAQLKALRLMADRRHIELDPILLERAVQRSKGDMRKTCNHLLDPEGDPQQDWSRIVRGTALVHLPERLKSCQRWISKHHALVIQECLDQLLSPHGDAAQRLQWCSELARAEQAIHLGSNPFVQLVPMILRLKQEGYWSG